VGAPQRHSTGTVQAQYRHSTGTVQAQYRHSTGTVQAQGHQGRLPRCEWGHRRGTRQAQYRHSTGTVQAQYRHSTCTVQAQYRHSTGTVQHRDTKAAFLDVSGGTAEAQYRHSTGTVQAQYRHSTGTVQAQSRHSTGTVQAQCRHRDTKAAFLDVSGGTAEAQDRHSTGTVQAQYRHSTGTVQAHPGNRPVPALSFPLKPSKAPEGSSQECTILRHPPLTSGLPLPCSGAPVLFPSARGLPLKLSWTCRPSPCSRSSWTPWPSSSTGTPQVHQGTTSAPPVHHQCTTSAPQVHPSAPEGHQGPPRVHTVHRLYATVTCMSAHVHQGCSSPCSTGGVGPPFPGHTTVGEMPMPPLPLLPLCAPWCAAVLPGMGLHP